MNEYESDLAERIYHALGEHSRRSDRSQQAAAFRVGLSDLGYCSERTRRMLKQEQPEDTDELLAFLGTAIGDHVEQAMATKFDCEVLTQQSVEVTLVGARRTYTVPGHPDMVIPSMNLVLDGKSAYGLSLVERAGPDQQKQFQRHAYGLGALESGLLDTSDPSEVLVGNVWIDRSGKQKRLHVNVEPLNLDVIAQAADWLDEVVYAYMNDSEAQKEPAREICQATCGFFETCRKYDTDIEGLITDPLTVMAVEMYAEGQVLEKRGKLYRDEAKVAIEGISGSTGKHMVRWVRVNAAKPYFRLDVKPV